MGAIVLFLTRNEKIADETLSIYKTDMFIPIMPKEIAHSAIGIMLQKLLVYAISFFYLLIPLVFYL